MAAVIGLDVDAEELDRLDLEAGFLEELPAEPVGGILGLLEEAARKVPVAPARLERTPGEEDAAVPLEDPLDAGDRVRPVALAAPLAAKVIPRTGETPAAARAEAPAVECAQLESSASTSSASCGQASIAQLPKARSVRTPSATPAAGSTHRNVPLRPKCPNVSGLQLAPVQ